jgi:hypothetical protein
MRKVSKMEIHRKADISVAGRGVAEDESSKMLDQKMQKKKVHWKDVSEEELKVVVYSGHGDIECEK